MKRTLASVCVLLPLLSSSDAVAIDAFDRHSFFWVQQAVRDRQGIEHISSKEANRLKSIGAGLPPCVVIETGEGNLAKVLLGWGYRKTDEQTTPVLMIERFVTYDSERRDKTVARGRDVILFPGFRFDFDIGHVVPEKQGGDVAFDDARRLRPLKGSKLYPLNGSAIPGAGEGDGYDPLAHDDVRPRDFSGDWKVTTDGRWRGVWRLSVDDGGDVQGSYLSAQTASSYKITGKVSGEAHRLRLQVHFDTGARDYEMFLWTSDKSAMAGTASILERKFGVFASREKKVVARKKQGDGEASATTKKPAKTAPRKPKKS